MPERLLSRQKLCRNTHWRIMRMEELQKGSNSYYILNNKAMIKSFEDLNLRVLIRYVEMPIFKSGGQEFETIPGNDQLVKQRHFISGIEIIDVNTKQIINLSYSAALAIAENIREI